MDITRLFDDFNIEYVTEGEHKHARPGWVNTSCPFCVGSGNPGYHLGWNEYDSFWMCWRCGWHAPVLTLCHILNLTDQETRNIIVQYGVNRSLLARKPQDKKGFKLPTNTTKLKKVHKYYLKHIRKFNPNKLEAIWGLKGTGHSSVLDSSFYKFRVIIPFMWNGEMVSFDSRDITGKQKEKYKACSLAREKVEHKTILYGNQEAWTDTGIIVEGPTDVFRLGEHAAATSGISYKPAQVRVIANSFKKVAVVFDDEPQAQKAAKQLVADLKFRNVDAYNIKIKGDPGGMSQSAADKLVKKILNK